MNECKYRVYENALDYRVLCGTVNMTHKALIIVYKNARRDDPLFVLEHRRAPPRVISARNQHQPTVLFTPVGFGLIAPAP